MGHDDRSITEEDFDRLGWSIDNDTNPLPNHALSSGIIPIPRS